MGWEDPVVGGVALRRAAIQSPNYVAGSTGWTINQDGSVEFNNGTFRGTVTAGTFQGTDFLINTSGEFFYSAAPATGNLVDSIARAAGTDGFSNAYPAGFTTYDRSNNLFVNTNASTIALGAIVAGAADLAHAGFVLAGGGLLKSGSSVTGALPDAVNWTLFSGTTGQTTGSGTAPAAQLLDTAASSDADLTVSGSVIKTDRSGVATTWQIPTITAASFANGGFAGELGCQYRFDAEDNLIVVVAVTVTAAGGVAAGTTTTLFTLPAAYRPAKGVRQAAYASTGAAGTYATGIVQSGGAVIIQNPTALAQNQTVQFQAMIPLGHLS